MNLEQHKCRELSPHFRRGLFALNAWYFSPPPSLYPGVRSTREDSRCLDRLIIHGGVQVQRRWYPTIR